MEIRPFTLADLDAARRLWEATEHLGPVSLVEIEAKLQRDPELFLVATDDDEVVGVVMGSFDGRRGWIFRLAVAESRRRSGVAAALVDAVEDRLRVLGCRKVNLLVLRDNDGGRSFWSAVGYRSFEGVVLCSKDLVPAREGEPQEASADC